MVLKRYKKLSAIIMTLAVMCLVIALGGAKASAANEGAGIVKGNDVNLREQPNTGSVSLAQANKSDNVVIIKWANNEWYEVVYRGKRGFMKAEFVAPIDGAVFPVGTGEIVGEIVNVREKPDQDAGVIKQLGLGKTVDVIGAFTKWYKVELDDGKTGYIHSDYVRIIFASDNTVAETSSSGTPVTVKSAKNYSYTNSTHSLSFDTNTTIGAMADLGMSLIGIDYKYGGISPETGFDCSGFIYYIAQQHGYDLPHNSGRQSKLGTKVSKDDLQLGDLVFFGPGGSVNHVGMYLGDGVFIHSSSGGDTVKLNNLSDSYYDKTYITGRRVF
ncbi:MAG: C40 family peptidase [Oscillospiraceae bacterium]|nr:C40 family peptidase [Oscillospiraceae bacterium]